MSADGFGGIAELVSDIEDGGIAEGAIAAASGAVRGPDSADPPGFGPGTVRRQSRSAGVRTWRTHGVATGRIGLCAQTGAENASAAATATLVKR